jgi:hypothetical protein
MRHHAITIPSHHVIMLITPLRHHDRLITTASRQNDTQISRQKDK